MLVKITQVSETNNTEELELGEYEIESIEELAGRVYAEIKGNQLICEWGNGEGEDVFEFEVLEETPKIRNGDFVTVERHKKYQHLVVNAVVSNPILHQHNGYRRVNVIAVFDNGSVEIETSGGVVDIVPLSACAKLYEITHEWFGANEEATIEEIQSMVDEFDGYEGWKLTVEANGDELRVYAYRESETAQRLSEWTTITDDMAYVVIGEEVNNW